MQIILKQRNIEAALKQYIASQGINLDGKKVEVEFTAGRKESGITAEIDIDDYNDNGQPAALGIVGLVTAIPTPANPIALESEAKTTEADAPVEATAGAAVAAGSSLFS